MKDSRKMSIPKKDGTCHKTPLGRRIAQTVKNHQWTIIGVFWLVTFGLGYIGVIRALPPGKEFRSHCDPFYRALQLFIMEDGMVIADYENHVTESPPAEKQDNKIAPSKLSLPREFEIARFLSPIVAASTVVVTLFAIFHEKLRGFRLKLTKNHVVICGLGRKGLLLAKVFRERGDRVVVIEQEQGNDLLELCRDLGAIVLIGNATDDDLLRTARVYRARQLICVCGDDGINAEIAMNARELIDHGKGRKLTCHIHIYDRELCNLLEERISDTDNSGSCDLEFFNIFDSGAKALLNEYPPYSEQCPVPHMLVVGVGRMGESLVVKAAKDWHTRHSGSGRRIHITLVDKKAVLKKESLSLRNPDLEPAWELTAREMDVSSPEFQSGKFLFDTQNRCDVTIVYICLDNDSFGLAVGLTLHKRIKDRDIPIVVRMTQDAGLAKLLHGVDGKNNFKNLHAFGLLDHLQAQL